MDKVSVVTVCYNADMTIAHTIESVLEQSYGSLEYLIIDGGSTDSTLQIAEGYRPLFAQKGIAYRIVSEKDTGIYNAMNKGIQMAGGEWLIFMNADDSFCDGQVVADVFSAADYDGYSAVYGDCYRLDGDGSYFMRASAIETLPKRMPFMHQSVFVRTAVCLQYLFDETYRLCADYDMFFRMYADGRQFFQVSRAICHYSINGVSGRRLLEAQDEVISIKKQFADRYPIRFTDRIGWDLARLQMQIKGRLPATLLNRLRAAKHSVRKG